MLNSLSHIFLNSNSGSIQINAPAGQANFSITKGLVLPNYTTAQLGTGVPAGTVTYNPTTGELWLFTGGTNCGQQQGQSFIPPANAQANSCWVKVGGAQAANVYWAAVGANNIHYSSNNAARVGVNTGTTAPRGTLDVKGNTPAYFSDVRGLVLPNFTKENLGNNVPAGTITWDNATGKLYVFQAGGQGQSLNDFLNTANAQTSGWKEIGAGGQAPTTYWQAGTGGIIHYPGGNVGIGTTAPAEKLDVVGNAKLSGTATVGGTLIAQNDIRLAPSNTATYTVKNAGGTIGFYNGSDAAKFTVGQDGALNVSGAGLLVRAYDNDRFVIQSGHEYGRKLIVRLSNLFNEDGTLKSNCVGAFLKINPTGGIPELMCDKLHVRPQQFNQEYIAHSAGGTATTDMGNIGGVVEGWRFCFLTKVGMPSGGECRIELENGTNWKLKAELTGGQNIQCRARCFNTGY